MHRDTHAHIHAHTGINAHTCTQAHVHTDVHALTHRYTQTHMCPQAQCPHRSTCPQMYMHVHTCTYAHVCVHRHVCTQRHMYTPKHTHRHTPCPWPRHSTEVNAGPCLPAGSCLECLHPGPARARGSAHPQAQTREVCCLQGGSVGSCAFPISGPGPHPPPTLSRGQTTAEAARKGEEAERP